MQNYESFETAIYILLASIVFILATYLGYLVNQIRMNNKAHELQDAKILAELEAQLKDTRESVRLIASATIQKKCDLSESCVRLANLMAKHEQFRGDKKLDSIFSMYSEIKEFPFLDERKKLTRQERKDQDAKRVRIEEKYNNDYLIACGFLKESLKKEVIH